MTIRNPSYETPGANDGEAQHWTDAQGAGAEDVALFDIGTRQVPFEAFEALWDNNDHAQVIFGLTDLISALFESGTHQHESFEYSWAMPNSPVSPPRFNHASESVFDSENFDAAGFDAALEEVEDFEEEWDDNEDSISDISAGTFPAASFDAGVPEAVEDFEEEWDSNENSETGFAPTVPGGGTLSAAQFDAGANAFENFEGAWVMTLPV